ncbi:MAG: hypothetical protein NZ555_05145 [Geminicoccaceae bacterium]|nr:hypothetical protein [Geminicoccaceae bacterium]
MKGGQDQRTVRGAAKPQMVVSRGERSAARDSNVVVGWDGPDPIAPKRTSCGVIGGITNAPDRIEAGLGSETVDPAGGNDRLIGDAEPLQFGDGGPHPIVVEAGDAVDVGDTVVLSVQSYRG